MLRPFIKSGVSFGAVLVYSLLFVFYDFFFVLFVIDTLNSIAIISYLII